MNTTKLITLALIAIISLAISLLTTQFVFKKIKATSESQEKFNLAFGVFFTSWVISFSMLNQKIVVILNEFIDLVYKTASTGQLITIVKSSILFIGLSNCWLLVCYFLTRVVSDLIAGKRTLINEIESNHYVYFLMYGFVFVSFVFSSIPIFEIILRIFLPNIEIPFYH